MCLQSRTQTQGPFCVCWVRARVPACDVCVSMAGRGGPEGGEPWREGPRIRTWEARGVSDPRWCGEQARGGPCTIVAGPSVSASVGSTLEQPDSQKSTGGPAIITEHSENAQITVSPSSPGDEDRNGTYRNGYYHVYGVAHKEIQISILGILRAFVIFEQIRVDGKNLHSSSSLGLLKTTVLL